jgi:uncharacterized cupin superfamily protein
MKVENTDLAKQLEAEKLTARFWRLQPGQASTKHRHIEGEEELYVVLKGTGRMRVGEEVLSPTRQCWSSPRRCARSSTTPTSPPSG